MKSDKVFMTLIMIVTISGTLFIGCQSNKSSNSSQEKSVLNDNSISKPECTFVEVSDSNQSIRSFEISKFEITNTQYAEYLNSNKIGIDGVLNGIMIINVSSPDLQLEYVNGKWMVKEGKENRPMVMVNYFGAVDFCRWIGGKLPNEMEWSYAAKGGLKSNNYTYAGGNILEEVGWFRGNCGGSSHDVGTLKPNELGIYDMSGNAWEWVLNDTLKTENDFVLHMGGSWFPGEAENRISARFGNTPTHFSNSVGFRVIFPVK
jgi:formylglycine-generating enzyme required for sulfatase activity